LDKGYIDFGRLHKIHSRGSYVVTRAKDNLRFKRMYSRLVNKASGVMSDQIGKSETYNSKKGFPDKLRRIKYYDQERDKTLVISDQKYRFEGRRDRIPIYETPGG